MSYSPSPGYAGSTEVFDACGFQPGEMADLIMDGAPVGQSTAESGCVHVRRQTALDIAPTTHTVTIKGEQSGAQEVGVYVVMPPMRTSSVRSCR